MNINSISFKGIYTIPYNSYIKNYRQLSAFSEKYSVDIEKASYDCQDVLYIHSPEEYDKKTIKFLSRKKIPFETLNPQEYLTNESINSRIVLSPEDKVFGHLLVKVNTKKLDEQLSKNGKYYVGINAKNGSKEKYDRFKKYLRTNQPINATSIYLKRKNDGSIITEVKDGRHRFAVLRDMGMREINISIDKNSVELAKELNLI